MKTYLAPEIVALLDGFVVADDGRSIRMTDRRVVEGDTPKQLRGALSAALYEEWHAGIDAAASAGRTRSHRRDHELEKVLTATVPHRTAAVDAVVGPRRTDPDGESVLVDLHRVRVRVAVDSVLGAALLTARTGDTVSLPLSSVRPALSPGFLLVNGSAGGPGPGEILRLYLHVGSPDHAPTVWGAVLRALESAGVPYRAKVLSRGSSYPRRDAVVVYLSASAWSVVPDLVDSATELHLLSPDTSALAHRVGPGIAVAWDPRDPRPGWERMSFGQHRGAAIAEAVVAAIENGERAAIPDAVAAGLAAARVDPAAPYRNADSPRLPTLSHRAALLSAVSG